MTKAGATPKPCPTVALEPVPVYVITENPALGLALTLEVMEPCVFVTVELPASQAHATYDLLDPFIHEAFPRLNPVESNDVRLLP
jgi:hypothetical protein